MRLRLRQLTNFNGFPLTSESYLWTTKIDYEGLEAVSRMVVTPFGTEIDLDGNYASPVKRLPIRAYLLLDTPAPTVADYVFEQLSQLCGLSGPLKGKAHGGTIVTCTARLTNFSGTLEAPWYTSTRSWQRISLTFRQKSNWS